MICYQPSMIEPSQRSSRIAVATGAVVALTLAIGGYVLGRSSASPPAPPSPPPAASKSQEVRTPVVAAPLDRGDLLAAVDAAANAYAAGRAGTPTNAALVGRRFEVRIPFGCYGAVPEDSAATLRWNYDAEKEALRISATPEVWADIAWAHALAGDRIEAVEGFWIPRPWSTDEACPTPEARMRVPPILPAPQQTVGLAQFFETGSSRVPRRDGKPYQTVEKVSLESLRATDGFRLVLGGRISALPSGQPIGCHSPGAELRPVCLVAVEFDRVAFENPQSGALLAEWEL